MSTDRTIRWSHSGPDLRLAVVALCGWCRKSDGRADRTGHRIAATDWTALSPAARDILTRHGVQP